MHAANPAGARVRVFGKVGRDGRSREHELPRQPPRVHLEAHGVPELRGKLPFVYEAWGFPREQRLGRDLREPDVLRAGRGVLHVEYAPGNPLGGCRLAAPLGPFNENRPADLESFTELGIRNAWYVFSVQHGYHLHG